MDPKTKPKKLTLKVPAPLVAQVQAKAADKARSPHSMALCALYLGLLAIEKRPEMLDVALKGIAGMREKDKS